MDEQNYHGYTGEEDYYSNKDKIEPPNRLSTQRLLPIFIVITTILLVIVIILSAVVIHLITPPRNSSQVVAVATSTTAAAATPLSTATTATTPLPTPTTVVLTPTPTTPSITVGSILCQADASHGWSGWKGTQDWGTLNGMLLNNGTGGQGGPTIIAPCDLQTIDYAVDATIQVVHWPHCCYSQFAITVRGSSDSGYWRGYSVGEDLNSSQVLISSQENFGGRLASAPFDPGSTSYTYRIEVKGNKIKVLINGSVFLDIMDNGHLSGTQVGLWSYEVQLTISNFKVTAL